jgi:peptidyl-Asp metalloendopeptidase
MLVELSLTLLTIFLGHSMTLAQEQELFNEIFGVKSDVYVSMDPTVVRHRLVGVNMDVLGTIDNPAETITLNLFDGVAFTAVFNRKETNALGSFAWIGYLKRFEDGKEIELGQAVLIVTKGVLSGSVSMPDGTFQVRNVGPDVYSIQEIDQANFPEEMEPIIVEPSEKELTQDLDSTAADPCDQITVLVAYSPEARAAQGGTAGIQALIALAVAETNQSYVNSGLIQRLVLVHTMETGPGDAANNFFTDLTNLQVITDGVFENVDEARETYFADIVALIIENSSSCGLGYLDSNAAYAFSVIHRTCATGYYSFGHELGHNMGAHHDWYVEGSIGYNKGFVNLTDDWRTIMAYNSLCSDHGDGHCSRLQYWSNPNVAYGSPPDPMGVSSTGPMNCAEGSLTPDPSTCAADNRTKLDNTCSTVANFRSAPPCEGDFNADGDVDGSDLAVFADDSGRTNCAIGLPCEGDFEPDGDVDGNDLAKFSPDFGRTGCP